MYELSDNQAGDYIRRLVAFLDDAKIDRRLAAVDRELATEKGIYGQFWARPRLRWWMGLRDARAVLEKQGTLRGQVTPGMYPAIDTAVKMVHLSRSMPTKIAKELSSRIVGADDLTAVLLEVDIAALFQSSGYEIEWLTSAGDGSRCAEFVAHRGEMHLEVECKAESADDGRRLLRRRVIRAFEAIVDTVRERDFRGCIEVVVSDRIPTHVGWSHELQAVLREVPLHDGAERHLGDGTVVKLSGLYTYDKRLSASLLERRTREDLDRQEGVDAFRHFCVSGRRDGEAVINPSVIRIGSVRKDAVVTAIYEDLKEARKQLSGRYPSLICCHLPEIDPSGFESVKDDSALRSMTDVFLHRDAPENVYAVSYSSDSQPAIIGGAQSSFVPSLAFRNTKYRMTSAGLPPLPSELQSRWRQ